MHPLFDHPHHYFFKKNGYLECEGLCSAEEVSQLRAALKQGIDERLEGAWPLEDLLWAGKNILSPTQKWKNWMRKKRWEELTGSLAGEQTCVFYFDTLLTSDHSGESLRSLSKTPTLQVGLILNLGEEGKEKLLPHKMGSGTFLQETYPIVIPPLYNPPHHWYLLLGFKK